MLLFHTRLILGHENFYFEIFTSSTFTYNFLARKKTPLYHTYETNPGTYYIHIRLPRAEYQG